jgi:hypothetical protein
MKGRIETPNRIETGLGLYKPQAGSRFYDHHSHQIRVEFPHQHAEEQQIEKQVDAPCFKTNPCRKLHELFSVFVICCNVGLAKYLSIDGPQWRATWPS